MTGNVGIGIGTPAFPFQIWDGGTNAWTGIGIDPGNNPSESTVIQTYKDGKRGLIIRAGSQDSGYGQSAVSLMAANGSFPSTIAFTSNILDFRVNAGYTTFITDANATSAGTSALYIGANGNVGIGTNNPDGRLEIKSGAATLKIGFAGGNAHHISSNVGMIFNGGDGNFLFRQISGSNPNNYVNVMTLVPGLLRVGGEIKCARVSVTADPWADYVFDKNYHLLPLAEVERFIEKNKHLPEIPSAKEIEKNGQDLGSLQVLQMQKIEELTLYLIAQEKRMQALEQKLLEMQKKK